MAGVLSSSGVLVSAICPVRYHVDVLLVGMLVCEFIVAIVGVTVGFNKTHLVDGVQIANNISAVNAQVAFIAVYIFFFAISWGPGAWVVIGSHLNGRSLSLY